MADPTTRLVPNHRPHHGPSPPGRRAWFETCARKAVPSRRRLARCTLDASGTVPSSTPRYQATVASGSSLSSGTGSPSSASRGYPYSRSAAGFASSTRIVSASTRTMASTLTARIARKRASLERSASSAMRRSVMSSPRLASAVAPPSGVRRTVWLQAMSRRQPSRVTMACSKCEGPERERKTRSRTGATMDRESAGTQVSSQRRPTTASRVHPVSVRKWSLP